MKNRVRTRRWEHYLTRSFSLFGSSFWHEWYLSRVPKTIMGANMPDAIFVEQKKNVVRCYRDTRQVRAFIGTIQKNAEREPNKLWKILRRGLALNSEAEKKLSKGMPFGSLKENMSFIVTYALLASTIPYFAGRYVSQKSRNGKLIRALRQVSYYQRLLDSIVAPLAIEVLRQKKFTQPERIYRQLTLREISSDSSRKLEIKTRARFGNRRFIFSSIGGRESVRYVRSTAPYIRKLEKNSMKRLRQLRGDSAFPGIVRGTARVIYHYEAEGMEFQSGDILVSINSNPDLMPLLKKCSAIVTDEGGVTCHAAIISRELRKPCVIGTKVATTVVHDGDTVEVNANTGQELCG